MSEPTDHVESADHLRAVRDELAQHWGPEFRRARTVVSDLANGDWHTISKLVQTHATSHRSVTQLTEKLAPWLDRRDKEVRVRPGLAGALTEAFGRADAAIVDEYETLASQATGALHSMEQILDARPRAVKHLDHVSATPLTCMKRAVFLSRSYDLGAARILFVGDHDLTSVALTHLCPDAELTVVDIDEDTLDCVAELSRSNGWSIRPIFADLRLELPRSLVESFDLVFMDPPYTPVGVQLFARRGIEALKQTDYARLVTCYGFGESHPGLGIKVQSVLHNLHLVLDAILPRFNRYTGAEAIGSQSALYVCRPTRKTRPTVAKRGQVDPRIYTHGKSAEESRSEALPLSASDELQQFVAQRPQGEITFVGDNFPEAMVADNPHMSLARYLHDMYRTQGKPPFTKEPHAGAIVANLYPHYDAYATRVLLASAAERVALITTHDALPDPSDPLSTLSEAKYHVDSVAGTAIPNAAIVTLTKVPAPESDGTSYVLRYLIDHRRAKIGNAWREALISWSVRLGRGLTKNQARQAIGQCKLSATYSQSYLSELPTSALRALVDDVRLSLEAADGTD